MLINYLTWALFSVLLSRRLDGVISDRAFGRYCAAKEVSVRVRNIRRMV